MYMLYLTEQQTYAMCHFSMTTVMHVVLVWKIKFNITQCDSSQYMYFKSFHLRKK